MTREDEVMRFLRTQPTEAEVKRRLIHEAQDCDRLEMRRDCMLQQGDQTSLDQQQQH